MDKNKLATILLLFIAVLWGYSFIPSSILINSGVSSELLLFARFGIGALGLGVVCFKQIKNSAKADVRAGLLAGLCIIFAIYMQNSSFGYTTVSKSAFISGSSIILVPFLAYFLNNSSITIKNIIGLILAVAGIVVLSVDITTFSSINFGDFLAMLSAIGFTMQIVLLAKFGKGTNSICVAFYQMSVVCIGGAILVIAKGGATDTLFTQDNIMALLYLGIFATVICYIIQAWAAKYVKEVVLSIIIASQAILASIFDVVLLGTSVTMQLIIGAVLISAAIIYLTLDKDNKRSLE